MFQVFRYPKNIISILCCAVMYFIFHVFVFNSILINQTIIDNHPIAYKAQLFITLILGHLSVLPLSSSLLLVGGSLLVGVNLVLAILRIQKVHSYGQLNLTLGGAGLMTIVSLGCTTCSIGFLSLIVPFAGVPTIFFNSTVFSAGTLGLLAGGTIISLRALNNDFCRISDSRTDSKHIPS